MYDKKVSIIVPKLDNNGAAHDFVLVSVSRALSLEFGGCTSQDVKGIWYNADGTRFSDESTLVWSLYDSAEHKDAQDKIVEIANYVKAALSQESVLVTIESAQVLFV